MPTVWLRSKKSWRQRRQRWEKCIEECARLSKVIFFQSTFWVHVVYCQHCCCWKYCFQSFESFKIDVLNYHNSNKGRPFTVLSDSVLWRFYNSSRSATSSFQKATGNQEQSNNKLNTMAFRTVRMIRVVRVFWSINKFFNSSVYADPKRETSFINF